MSATPEHRTLAESRKQSRLASEYFARTAVELEDAEGRLETGLKDATKGILKGLAPTALDRLHRNVAKARTVVLHSELLFQGVPAGRLDRGRRHDLTEREMDGLLLGGTRRAAGLRSWLP